MIELASESLDVTVDGGCSLLSTGLLRRRSWSERSGVSLFVPPHPEVRFADAPSAGEIEPAVKRFSEQSELLLSMATSTVISASRKSHRKREMRPGVAADAHLKRRPSQIDEPPAERTKDEGEDVW